MKGEVGVVTWEQSNSVKESYCDVCANTRERDTHTVIFYWKMPHANQNILYIWPLLGL